MAKRAANRDLEALPSEAGNSGPASDVSNFENSFTAKDQHDHLEAAIREWADDNEIDVVQVEAISNGPASTEAIADSNQGKVWWAWVKANAVSKATIIKSAIALLIAIILGWMPMQRLLATTSVEAVTNARAIIIRTPIEGEVSALSADLQAGREFHAGDELITIKNPRADQSSLDNLMRLREQLTTTVTVLQAKKVVLKKHLSELSAQKERYRISRIGQLEKQITQIDAGVTAAKAQHEVTAKTLGRARILFEKGTVPQTFVEKAVSDESVASQAINGLLERRKATEIELAAARKGTFTSDGYNDTSELAQRGLDVELQLAEVDARLTGAIDELAAINQDIVKESERRQELSTAVIRAQVSGRVWEVMTAPGEHVNAGQELLRLLDCSGMIVTASVSEATYRSLKIGQRATFKPSNGNPEVKGWVTGLTGLAAVASNDAIQPKTLSGAPYHVTLKFPGLDRAPNCQVSLPGLVTFDTSSLANFATIN